MPRLTLCDIKNCSEKWEVSVAVLMKIKLRAKEKKQKFFLEFLV